MSAWEKSILEQKKQIHKSETRTKRPGKRVRTDHGDKVALQFNCPTVRMDLTFCLSEMKATGELGCEEFLWLLH